MNDDLREEYQFDYSLAKCNRFVGPLPPGVSEVLTKCKTALEGYYGPRFKGLLLYGSLARKQASPASDIDLLVLLSEPLDYFRELRQIIALLYPIQLESDQLISAKPAVRDDFEHGTVQLYRNAKREGVLV